MLNKQRLSDRLLRYDRRIGDCLDCGHKTLRGKKHLLNGIASINCRVKDCKCTSKSLK